MGDYVPSGPLWQMLTAVEAITAFGLATLVITYVASLNSAVAAKRQFARHVFGLGDSPIEILTSSWTGREFRLLEDHLVSLSRDIHEMVEAELTYPLLHYFLTRHRMAAEWPAIAVLNEVVLLMDNYVETRYRPARLAVDPVEGDRASLPSPAEIRALRDAGIPVLSGAKPSERDLRRRHRVRAVLERQGWPWDIALGTETVSGGAPSVRDRR